ncbi:unnamed protein product, partial [Brassica rapa]
MHRRLSSTEKGKAVELAHHIRDKFHVNGRLPIIKSSTIEFSEGGEVIATLAYEKLERHCLKCGRLDHEVRDCLEAKHEKRAQLALEGDSLRSRASANKEVTPPQTKRSTAGGPDRHSPRRTSRFTPYSKTELSTRQRHSHAREDAQQRYHPNYQRGRHQREEAHYGKDAYDHIRRKRYEHTSRLPSPPHRERTNFSGVSHSANSPKEHSRRVSARCYSPKEKQNRQEACGHMEDSRSPQTKHLPPLPTEAMEIAVEEVREAMLQYTNCADPTESAARRERLRLAEAQGEVEESAALMVRASLARDATTETIDETMRATASPPARVPIASRLGKPPRQLQAAPARAPIMDILGPLLDEASTFEEDLMRGEPQNQKRKPGRPPGRKKATASPLSLVGTSVKKRKVQQTKPPTCRRKLMGAAGRDGKTSKAQKGR